MLGLGSCAAPEGARTATGFNLLLITLDTVRADRLGAYGYEAAETPHLDRLAQQGLLFEQVNTTVPLTLPAHATLLSGLAPTEHGLRGNGGGELQPSVPTLATALAAKGYRTGAFVGAFVLDARFGLARGFEVYDDEMRLSGSMDPTLDSANPEAERPGREVVDRALGWLGQAGPRPFFAWVHLYDAHAPYAPGEPFASRHPGRPYDGEIAQADEQVGRLLTWLDQQGLAEQTVVVVTSDHGEGLGDHGELTHGLLLYESTLRVPLLLRAPGVMAAGARVGAAVSLTELAPTLAGLLDVRLSSSGRLGRDLSPDLLRGEAPREGEIYSETRYPESFGWSALTALRKGRLKYIQAPRPELYDLETDPDEAHNRLEAQGPLAKGATEAAGFAARLAELASSAIASRESELDAASRARLSALGYVSPPAARVAPSGSKRDPKDAVGLFRAFEQAHWYRLAGRHREAVALLKRLVDDDPANSVFRTELAAAQRAVGELDSAIALLKEAVALAPRDPDAWYNLGTALAARGLYPEAREALRGALEHDPKRPEALNALGIAYAAQDELEEARATLERAVEMEADNARAWNNLGNVCRDLGRAEQAVQSYERAIQLAPGYSDPWNGLGTLEAARDRSARALSYFEKALELSPELHEARLNRAIALELAGDRDAAVAGYRDFLARSAVDPTFAQQRQVASRLLSQLVRAEGSGRERR